MSTVYDYYRHHCPLNVVVIVPHVHFTSVLHVGNPFTNTPTSLSEMDNTVNFTDTPPHSETTMTPIHTPSNSEPSATPIPTPDDVHSGKGRGTIIRSGDFIISF